MGACSSLQPGYNSGGDIQQLQSIRQIQTQSSLIKTESSVSQIRDPLSLQDIPSGSFFLNISASSDAIEPKFQLSLNLYECIDDSLIFE